MTVMILALFETSRMSCTVHMLKQWSFQSGTQISSISTTWKLVRNVNFQATLRPTKLDNLGTRARDLF